MKYLILFNTMLIFLNAYLIKLDNKCFIEYYDTTKKTPVLAYYTLTKEEVEKKNPKRIAYFSIDRRIPKKYRTKSSEYRHTGFDRGHQVGNNIVDYNITCQKYSFKMSNITPQLPKFNRGAYKAIENYELFLAKKYGKIFIIEGNFGSMGKINSINIPKYFFKIFFTKHKIFYIIINQKGKFFNINLLKKQKIFERIKDVNSSLSKKMRLFKIH